MQVALSLAIVPTAVEMSWGTFRPAIVGPSLPVHEYLTASLATERDDVRFDDLAREIVRRLAGEPGITGVSASSAALMDEPFDDLEIEGAGPEGPQARYNAVDGAFFEIFGARVLAGRTFEAGDFGSAGTAAVVNRSFVSELMNGENPLGRRVRLLGAEGTPNAGEPPVWHDIVGVVADFPGNNDGPMVYLPLTAGVHPITLTLRSPSGLATAAASVRAIPPSIDPSLRVGAVQSLADEYSQRRSSEQMFGVFLGAVTAIVLLLSMAGIHTLMAFIVAQRWREIGLRSALGAGPRRLLAGIFGRAFVPLTIGLAAGGPLAALINGAVPVAEAGGQPIAGIIPLSAALMLAAALLAIAGPTRRALRIDPTRALRVD
jgi:hypothetical protein